MSVLEFEKPLVEIEKKIQELKKTCLVLYMKAQRYTRC